MWGMMCCGFDLLRLDLLRLEVEHVTERRLTPVSAVVITDVVVFR